MSANRSRPEFESCVPVFLNVYDMAPINVYVEGIGLGLYHTGTEVYNTEYSYGGYPSESSGIFTITPKSDESLGKDSFKFKQSILMGFTTYSEERVIKILDSYGKLRFKAKKYHLFRNNCNHFTTIFVEQLCGECIPLWVNRIARICARIPFLEQALPIEIITPSILLQDEEPDQSKDNLVLIERQNNFIV